MQLRGSWGLCDPGPVAQRGAAIPAQSPIPGVSPGSAAGSREGGGRRAEGRAGAGAGKS